jgi:MarR family transcriptional regulator, lower aerobic nicotinate degradation pathway regulator
LSTGTVDPPLVARVTGYHRIVTRTSRQQPLTERVGYLTHKTGQLLLWSVEDRLRDLGLASRTYFVLAGLDNRDEPISQQDLCRLLSIDPTTMVALVDDLERSGFLVRSRNSRDRRRYDLLLTPRGATTLAAAHKAMAAAEKEFYAPLSAQELEEYQKYLRRLLDGRWPPQS